MSIILMDKACQKVQMDLEGEDSGFGLCLAEVMVGFVQPVLAWRHKGIDADGIFER